MIIATENDYFIHKTSCIDSDATIGPGTKIWHYSHVMSGAKIGQDCVIGKYVEIGPGVVICKNSKIQNNVSIFKGVTLEDQVFCGPSVVFSNVINPRAFIRRMDELRPTLVKKGATLGANCTIICGVTIGKYAMIGAGAVVTRDVPDHALVMGSPARQTGWVCKCGNKARKDLLCDDCSNHK